MAAQIQIHNLSKSFGKKQALRQVDLTIGEGMFGLLGPNGAGKTTFMKILTTLLRKSEGEVVICGVPVERATEVRRMTGYLPQDFSMYGNMSAQEALDYLAALSGMSRAQRREKVPEMLEKVNLLEQRSTRVKAMSGGMKRRLGIAQAIIHDPRVIIVDEPTAGLDPEERVRFRNLISDFAKEKIVILSTHIVSDIEAIADEVLLMKKGKVLIQGTVSELTKKAAGKVWELTVSPSEAKIWQEKAAVANLRHEGEQVVLRILSDVKPAEGAAHCEAGLEDLYLYSMREYPK